MKNFFKKIAFFVALVGMSFASISTSAESNTTFLKETTKFNENNELAEMYDYISAALPEHLAIFNCSVTGITISNLFSLNAIGTANDGIYVCFIMKEKSVIGELTITSVNNEYYSSFSMASYPDVTEAIHNKTAVAFVADGNSFYMVDSSNSIKTLSTANCDSINLLAVNRSETNNYEFKTIQPLITLNNTSASRTMTYLHRVRYDLQLVANSSTYNSTGQCWASCIASKVMYEVVQYMNANLDSDTVYAATEEEYGSVGTGKTRYRRGLSVYGITANSNSNDQVFSFENLHSKSQNANMVIMRMRDTNNSATHAVLLAGYYILTDITGSKYYVMDPNRSTFVSFDIDRDQYNTGENVIYTTNYGYVFTWFDSMYST